jgi:hypothetical protein
MYFSLIVLLFLLIAYHSVIIFLPSAGAGKCTIIYLLPQSHSAQVGRDAHILRFIYTVWASGLALE